MSADNFIEIKGAKVHNLKNIDLKIPKNKFIVFTGISGSGKSSLAFDTLYAEGQRRYVESLSSYARQFLGIMDKPDVESITGLSPAISIDQKTSIHSPRSTVGTVTEIYDYLRLLFAKIGKIHCYSCGKPVLGQTLHQIRNTILELASGGQKKVFILAPVVRQRKGTFQEVFRAFQTKGYSRARVDGETIELTKETTLEKNKKHNIDIVVDRLIIKSDLDTQESDEQKKRILDSLETTINISGAEIIVLVENKPNKFDEHFFSEENYCSDCDIYIPKITPSSFSFNSPQGACENCHGIGFIREIDPKLIYNPRLTIREGGIYPWAKMTTAVDSWFLRMISSVAKQENFDLNTRLGDYPEEILNLVLYGNDKKYLVEVETKSGFLNKYETRFEGVIPNLERRYRETNSDYIRREIEVFMRDIECSVCKGKRLKPHALAVKVSDMNIDEITNLDIDQAYTWARSLYDIKNGKGILSKQDYQIAKTVLREISARLSFLSFVGLNYLTLSRSARTLSGGESQRIRLASQIGTGLTGVLYVLDEPSIGLHQRDNTRLIKTLQNLRDLGNTVVVVEHDEETMLSSDWLVDFGPGAGEHGGEVVYNGLSSEITKGANTITKDYLLNKKIVGIEYVNSRRAGNGQELKILKAQENNLKDVDVTIPLNKFITITGVSGSGKSTLINDVLYKNVLNQIQGGKQVPGRCDDIIGIENIDKIIEVDQSPIGRTPRSNPATYTGMFTDIRNLYSSLPESKSRGYTPGRFSFNVKSGRCENCQGDGVIKIEMQFLSDVYIDCEVCKGKRYTEEVLQIDFKGKNIADVLDMRVEEALEFFDAFPSIKRKLATLDEVGLSYIKLGQPAPQLSGGEAQRVKLSTELSKSVRGHTLYLLDEPTTGLHFSDVDNLLKVLHRLVDKNNTVIVIEHNLDVIKTADWVIDLGPEGGNKGGQIVAIGTPEEIVKNEKSWTGQYLKKALEKRLIK